MAFAFEKLTILVTVSYNFSLLLTLQFEVLLSMLKKPWPKRISLPLSSRFHFHKEKICKLLLGLDYDFSLYALYSSFLIILILIPPSPGNLQRNSLVLQWCWGLSFLLSHAPGQWPSFVSFFVYTNVFYF